jgi:hypothetical protein
VSIIAEKDINSIIGKNSIWASRTSLLCTTYIGGIADFDDVIDIDSIFANKMPTNIYLHPAGVEISVMYKFKLRKIGIPFKDIVSVHIEDKTAVTERKEKSIIGRALVGGLLFGPVGAIIGGMTGLGTKEKVIFTPDLIMTVLYLDGENTEKAIVFTSKYSDRSKLLIDARQVFQSKLTIEI